MLEHFGRDLNRFTFNGQPWYVRDLENLLLDSPAAAVGNLWLVEVRPAEVRLRVEADRPDPVLYRRLEERVREAMGLPLAIDAVPPGTLLDRAWLMRVEPGATPRVVGYLKHADDPPLKFSDLI